MSELPPPLPNQEAAQLPPPANTGENWILESGVADGREITGEISQAIDVGASALSSEVDITPASQLGVIDGDFNVHRSDGSVEKGWSVRRSAWKDKGTGNVLVTVEKTDPKNPSGVLKKDIPASEFISWQESAVEDLPEVPEAPFEITYNADGIPYDNSFPANSTGFRVMRTDGSVDTDWAITRLTPSEAEGKTYAEITKTNPVTKEKITKVVSTDTLKEWQVIDSTPEPEAKKPVGFIDKVPKSEQEAKQMMDDAEGDAYRLKVEANAPRVAELQARFDQIKLEVGEEQSQLLWRYGSYDSQARELDLKGNKGAAGDLYKYADEELAKMKPETARFKKEYWAIMTEKHALEFPK